jgi:hypothetical protein
LVHNSSAGSLSLWQTAAGAGILKHFLPGVKNISEKFKGVQKITVRGGGPQAASEYLPAANAPAILKPETRRQRRPVKDIRFGRMT